MINYIMLFGAAVFLAGQFVMNKFFQSKNGSDIVTSLFYTSIAGGSTSLLFFIVNGFKISEIEWFSLLCSFGVAALVVLYMLIGFKIFSLGNLSAYSLFLMLGGMILPFVYGMVFLGDRENLSTAAFISRIIGVVLLIISMFFPLITKKNPEISEKKNKNSVLFIILCIAIFIMNGFVSIISKTHQIDTAHDKVDNITFVIFNNGFKFVIAGIALIIVCLVKKQKPRLADGYRPIRFIANLIIYAAFNGSSYFLQLKVAASDLPASVQYPMLTGGSVILTALAGFLVFREKPSKMAFIGLIITFAATFLFLVG